MKITVTDSAISHIKKSLAKRGKGLGLRLAVKTSGCSGLSYKIEYVDENQSDDLIKELDSFSIFIDPKSYPYLEGLTLDFRKEGLNEGFKIENPNVKDECGCGESFRV